MTPVTSELAGSAETEKDLLRRHAAALSAPDEADLVVEPDHEGPGSWAGGPSAVLVDGTFVLSYRLRRPIGHGRGHANVIARSDDGVQFDTVAIVTKEQFGADSLERPAIVRTPAGRWRLYVSPNTPRSDHWRVEVLEADSLEDLPSATPRAVLTGSSELAVKDPVILHSQDRWHLWASCHPLDDPRHTDRMTTEYATSDDGLDWEWQGTALAGRPDHWDERGVRIAAVLLTDGAPLAYYDGRATAEENWEERTGIAVGDSVGELGLARFHAVGDAPVGQSPHGAHGLRYVSVVPLGDGSHRYYFEVTRPDGAHELRTRLVPAAEPPSQELPA